MEFQVRLRKIIGSDRVLNVIQHNKNMPKFEDVPNIDTQEINPKLRPENPKEMIELKLSPKEEFENLEGEVKIRQEEISKLSESIEGTKTKLNQTRENLGLPPHEGEPPSMLGGKDKLEKLKAEQAALEKQKENLLSQQEKEELIRKEKEKILQEKIDQLFKEFDALSSDEFENILNSGKMSNERSVESKSMGSLDPKVAKSLARAFKEGIKLLPKILEELPDLLKEFDKESDKRSDRTC